MGPAYAKDILYSARTVDAEEALRIGFIQRLVPAAELQQVTHDYLATLADNAPLSVRMAHEYAYVARDVRHILLTAGLMVAILAVLAILINVLGVIKI